MRSIFLWGRVPYVVDLDSNDLDLMLRSVRTKHIFQTKGSRLRTSFAASPSWNVSCAPRPRSRSCCKKLWRAIY
jgi:hypothetical protein